MSGFPGGARPCLPMQEMEDTWVPSLGQEDPLEEGMAAHSSILAWRIPGTEEPGGLQPIGTKRLRHDRSDFTRACILCVNNRW